MIDPRIFRPTKARVLLGALLMGVLNFVAIAGTTVFDAEILLGTPFGFYPKGTNTWGPSPGLTFSPAIFLLDAAFWYAVSCFALRIWRTFVPGRKERSEKA
jgi:hypothetical protein